MISSSCKLFKFKGSFILPPSKNFEGKTGFGCIKRPQPVKLFDRFLQARSCLFFRLLLLLFPNFGGCLLPLLPPVEVLDTGEGESKSTEDILVFWKRTKLIITIHFKRCTMNINILSNYIKYNGNLIFNDSTKKKNCSLFIDTLWLEILL